jgi:hypothetical protein
VRLKHLLAWLQSTIDIAQVRIEMQQDFCFTFGWRNMPGLFVFKFYRNNFSLSFRAAYPLLPVEKVHGHFEEGTSHPLE